MRIAIMADIHSNLHALQAVLQHIEQEGGVDELWCLGDVVGYGPYPTECVQLLRQHRHVCIAGNHDLAAIGKIDIADFNPEAAEAVRWTGEQLDTSALAYLDGLPPVLQRDDFTLAHGSPRDPVWEYLLSESAAQSSLSLFQTRHCLIGHSHVPLCFVCSSESACSLSELDPATELPPGGPRLIVNPGSVGQPRDHDPRASYAIYDSDARVLRHYRVAYDIPAVQQKMLECGLPPRLALRLSYGW